MKTTTKLMAVAMSVAAILCGKNVNAQMTSTAPAMTTMSSSSPWRFGIGVETGITTGNVAKISSWDVAGTARLQYNVDNNWGIILTSGYYNFFAGNNNVNTTTKFGPDYYGTNTHDLGMIPVKAGFKNYWGNGMYLTAEGGVGFETKYNEDKKLILAPGLGWSDKSIDASVRYENFSGQNNNYGLVNVRIAYGFAL
jgi:hypothetical protein